MGSPHLSLWWEPDDRSEVDNARGLSQFVNGLPAFDPVYESWLESPETQNDVLPVPLSEAAATQILTDSRTRDDLGRLMPRLGSHVAAGHAGSPPYDFRESHIAGTRCGIGNSARSGAVLPNFLFMRLAALRSPTGRPWRASELRPLMKFAREIWRPGEMCALFSFSSRFLPEIPDPSWAAGKRTLKPWIGWITYLPPHLAARANHPGDVDVETLDDGAALVTLCEEPFDKTDAEGMARLHALEAALRPIQS
ncbi:immunity protein 52 of polymorphic toxin system [Roseiarcus fermentans]|uniref:Immunity protein 52 of polymorphic toxin system n=1 Tax=Roseiarcus fermentans TaxID=1473586 RepID=A0A366EUI2_9HYPH|nr:Imm52 family immunity protein [Roseiarcus fermentans]RBP05159.1 immunity protein 52 of polymorphic toxin system [Roseiarcus fermentans]